ncbi:hypothetical protein CC86DRAFT_412866 [Ophiobolus disseminans]|uniref:Cyanovirin-N domain-containing protein n=1 Tax=Ophiobolus disseminans TaxID=1469910 RepID=A0A6A6ZEM1_9PLEO|nr:hypothetical protein CC86DRAFT_412866 [Ophiobolus disseminans]
MRFAAILAPLSLAGYCSAWAQQGGTGIWVANNVWHRIGEIYVHEACTKMGTQEFWRSGHCAYWADGDGHITQGTCRRWGSAGVDIICYPP